MEVKKYFERKKSIALAAIGLGIGAFALSSCGYDNDAHPSVGIVTQHAEPNQTCAPKTGCQWHYWLYVDGCGELSEEAVRTAKEQEEGWEPSKGWIEVSPDTWSETADGEEIIFREKGFLSSIQLFGLGRDDPESC
jgi:hypothetical protein